MFVGRQELEATKAKLAKINARAAKRGFTGRFDIVATPKTVTYNTNGFEVTKHGFDAEITGVAPSYEGWTFLARVENLGDNAIISAAPGSDITLKNEDFAAGGCEHCNTNRYRKHTFIVRNDETAEVKQVGSTCIKDFLGWDGKFVFIDEDEVSEKVFEGAGSSHFDYGVLYVAILAFAVAEVFGYVSSQDWSGNSTKDVVAGILTGSRGSKEIAEKIQEHFVSPEEAQRRIDFVLDSFTQDYGYEANMRSVFSAEAVEYKHLGLAVSIAAAYKRLVEKEAEKKAKAEEVPSQWVGSEGERIEFEGTVVMARSIESNYGYHPSTTNLISVLTEEGNVIKMFTSAGWAYEIEEGDVVKIMARVKKHDEFKGRKETLVNRPKIVK